MPLLVVAIASSDAGLLSLDEWDRLAHSDKVWFEDPAHPLIERLRDAGVSAGPFDDEPSVSADRWALVLDPGSPRLLELARAGAELSTGAPGSPDTLTSAHGAAAIRGAATAFADLVAVMARLRSDDGCPWDREQTHESLKIHLLEEAYEVDDAITRGHLGEDLEEELGDVLLQVVFHSRLAEQDGRFDVAGVAQHLVAKLVHRHPHVFGTRTVADSQEVLRNWETLKAEEKARPGIFDGIPMHLPALLTAYKSQKRAAQAAFEVTEGDALARVRSGIEALGDDRALGDVLFWLVAVARARGIDPEGALREAVARFQADVSERSASDPAG